MSLKSLSIALASGASALALAGGALAAPADSAYHAPRNAFGQPDLQGNWTNATITPSNARRSTAIAWR